MVTKGNRAKEVKDEDGAIEGNAWGFLDGNICRNCNNVDKEQEGRQKRGIWEGERTMRRLVKMLPSIPLHLIPFAATLSAVKVPVLRWKAIRVELLAPVLRTLV